jgi:hypothetical protein
MNTVRILEGPGFHQASLVLHEFQFRRSPPAPLDIRNGSKSQRFHTIETYTMDFEIVEYVSP